MSTPIHFGDCDRALGRYRGVGAGWTLKSMNKKSLCECIYGQVMMYMGPSSLGESYDVQDHHRMPTWQA